MGEVTGIAWCDSTFNPWIGCSRVSPGCVNCYAEQQNTFRRWTVGPKTESTPADEKLWGPGAPRKRTSVAYWRKPYAWNAAAKAEHEVNPEGRRPRVFCASLADVFDAEVPLQWRLDLFTLIRATPYLDWLILTKRPALARAFFTGEQALSWMSHPTGGTPAYLAYMGPPGSQPLANLWLGTTVENNAVAEERIEQLIRTPAAVRFLSIEPQLEDIELGLLGIVPRSWGLGYNPVAQFIQWVITGGESGAHARPYDTAWARSIIKQCRHGGGIAPFVKQLGAAAIDAVNGVAGVSAKVPSEVTVRRLHDRAGADPSEWPEDLRVQEFPLSPAAMLPEGGFWSALK